jgi:hypothetical protein
MSATRETRTETGTHQRGFRKKLFPTLRAYEEKITPEKAQQYLDMTGGNRPIDWRTVSQYAGAMQRKEWLDSASAIQRDWYGRLIDGHHRCWASVVSGESFTSLVIVGMDPEAQKVIDTGKRRTLSNTLEREGEERTMLLSALIVHMWKWEQGYPATGQRGGNVPYTPTNAQSLAVLDRHPLLRDTALWMSRNGKRLGKVGAGGAPVAFCYHVLRSIDQELADEFFEKIITGEDLARDNPVLLLRNWFLRAKDSPRATVAPRTKMAFVLKAWNLWAQGERRARLVWRHGTPFPVPFGAEGWIDWEANREQTRAEGGGTDEKHPGSA